MTRLIVVGDALLDRDLDGRAERLAPDAPVPVVDAIEATARARAAPAWPRRSRRAPGSTSRSSARSGATRRARSSRALLEEAGVNVVDLGLARRDAGEGPRARRRTARSSASTAAARRAAAARCPPGALDGADAVLVSDYGRGVAAEPTRARRARSRARCRSSGTPTRRAPTRPGRDARHPEPEGGAAAANRRGTVPPRFGRSPPARPPRACLARAAGARSRVVRDARRARRGGSSPVTARRSPSPRRASRPATRAAPATASRRPPPGRLAAGALPSEAVRAAVEAASAFVAGERADAAASAPPATPPSSPRACAGRRHRGRDRRLLRPAARRPRPHARAGASARRLPDRLPELRRLGAAAQGRRSPARRAGRPRRRARRARRASTPSRSSTRTTRARSCATLRPHVWAKGGDYAVAELARGRRRSPSGAGAR